MLYPLDGSNCDAALKNICKTMDELKEKVNFDKIETKTIVWYIFL